MTAPHASTVSLGLLAQPTRFLFFTGKGGVGKTSLSTATAIALADAGRQVLLVSTDAASNLDEMLGVPLSNQPVAVPGVPGLHMLNIDPDTAAEAYRQRVLAQLEATATCDERAISRYASFWARHAGTAHRDGATDFFHLCLGRFPRPWQRL